MGSVDKNVMPIALLGQADLRVDEVTSINRAAKTVTTAQHETIGHDKLILATGSRPVVPPLPGVNLANVFIIRKEIACT